MGRKPNPLILKYFDRGAKLPDNSNRYEHTCKRCGEKYPKGRADVLIAHILKKCTGITHNDRRKAMHEATGVPDDGTYNIQAQNNLPGLQAPNGGSNWSGLEGLELLAKASENFVEHPPNLSRNAQLQANGPSHLKLQEQYTLDNPPVSYEQRGSRDRKLLDQQKRDRLNREHGGEAQMQLPYNGFNPDEVDMNQLDHNATYQPRDPQMGPGRYNVSRSASPNFNMAQRAVATTIAQQAAAASFAPSMVDPDILRDEAAIAERNALASTERAFAQQLQEANSAMPPVDYHRDGSHDVDGPWPVDEEMGDDVYSEPAATAQQSVEPAQDQSVNYQMQEVAYRPLPILHADNPHGPTTSKFSKFSPETGDGSRTSGREKQRVRGPFDPRRRLQVQGVRKIGACIRCKILKKSCSNDDPCKACASVDSARVWKQPCTRRRPDKEMDMFVAGLHHTLMKNKLEQEKGEIHFQPSSIQIEASHHPDAGIFATFHVYEGTTIVPNNNIDPGLNEHPVHDTVYYIDSDASDIGSQIDTYTHAMRDEFFRREPSSFMRATLSTAHSFLVGKETTKKDDSLLSDAMDLWSMVHILVDPESKWACTKRTNTHAPAGSGDQINLRSWHIIRSQLSASVEKKAALLTKTVLSNLLKRLLNASAKRSFELFLVGILVLNCLEKTTWFFNLYEQLPNLGDWPLENKPLFYASQGESVTNMLNMLLRIKGIAPTVVTVDGLLRSDYHADAREYFEKVGLSEAQVTHAKLHAQFNQLDSRCFELRFSGRLLLNDPAEDAKPTRQDFH